MPTYDYRCDACGHTFEQFQSIMAEPVKKCPVCGRKKVKRLIGTGAGLIFKGSGFYITDYRDQSYKDKAKAESGNGEAKKETTTAAASAGATDTSAKPATTDAKPAAAESKPAAAPATSKSETKPAARKDSAKKR